MPLTDPNPSRPSARFIPLVVQTLASKAFFDCTLLTPRTNARRPLGEGLLLRKQPSNDAKALSAFAFPPPGRKHMQKPLQAVLPRERCRVPKRSRSQNWCLQGGDLSHCPFSDFSVAGAEDHSLKLPA